MELPVSKTPRPSLRLLLALPWVLTLAILTILWWSMTHVQKVSDHKEHCRSNLTQIYKAVELFALENDTLPSLAFYPESVERGSDSLIHALRGYGLDPIYAICPVSPDPVYWKGLSYVWNPSLNGKRFEDILDPIWMIVDIQAISDEVPPPHFGSYLVLYSDGSIVETQEPPVLRR